MNVVLQKTVKAIVVVVGTLLVLVAAQMIGLQVFLSLPGIERNGVDGLALFSSVIFAVLVAMWVAYLLFRANYSWITDKLKEIGVALALIATALSLFFIADEFNIDGRWVLVGMISMTFSPMMTWEYRSKWKSPFFVLFMVVWMFLHGLIFVYAFTQGYGWGGWLTFLPIELFLFYVSMFLIFRVEPQKPKTEDY